MVHRNIICEICGKEFTSTLASFRRHLKDKHNIIENVEYNVKCMQPSCIFTCSKLENLRQHLEVDHQIAQELEELLFENIEEFNKWKKNEEQVCVTTWLKRRVLKKGKIVTIYYYCNRSGKKRLLGASQRKRRIKKQGSRKIDFACTSAIIVKIISHGITVKYYKNHYGHDNKRTHIPLSAEIKSMIASQLLQGLSPTEILNNIKENKALNSDQVNLITRKVISNILHEYNLSDIAGKLDKVTNKIKRSHLIAANSTSMLAVKFEDGWIVLSEDESFSIKSNEIEENHLCKLKCVACATCIHHYSCTCIDFVVHDNMCKHIHKVCISEAIERNRQEAQKQEEENIEIIQEDIRSNINSILMSDWRDITDLGTLNRIDCHLTSALNLINCDPGFTQERVVHVEEGDGDQIRISESETTQPCFKEMKTITTQFVQDEGTPKVPNNYCLIIPAQVTGTLDSTTGKIINVLPHCQSIIPDKDSVSNVPYVMHRP